MLEPQDELAQSAAHVRRLHAELENERAKNARLLNANKSLAHDLHELRTILDSTDADCDRKRYFAGLWKALAKRYRWWVNECNADISTITAATLEENKALRAEVHAHEDRWQRVVALGREIRIPDLNPNYGIGHLVAKYADILTEPTEADEPAEGNVEAVAFLENLLQTQSPKWQLGVKLLRDGAKMPARATDRAAGLDVFACIDQPIFIGPGRVAKIPLGFALETPPGYFLDCRGRSGNDSRNNYTVRLGTIDDDFRGELCAIVKAPLFLSDDGRAIVGGCEIKPGDKVAQLVLGEVVNMPIVEVAELSETARGASGFGSTGAT